MKFNCTIKQPVNREEWHRHFALLPRRCSDGTCRWLEFVERKGTYVENEFYGYPTEEVEGWWTYEYRALT